MAPYGLDPRQQPSHAKSTRRCVVARTPGDGPHAATITQSTSIPHAGTVDWEQALLLHVPVPGGVPGVSLFKKFFAQCSHECRSTQSE